MKDDLEMIIPVLLLADDQCVSNPGLSAQPGSDLNLAAFWSSKGFGLLRLHLPLIASSWQLHSIRSELLRTCITYPLVDY